MSAQFLNYAHVRKSLILGFYQNLLLLAFVFSFSAKEHFKYASLSIITNYGSPSQHFNYINCWKILTLSLNLERYFICLLLVGLVLGDANHDKKGSNGCLWFHFGSHFRTMTGSEGYMFTIVYFSLATATFWVHNAIMVIHKVNFNMQSCCLACGVLLLVLMVRSVT